MTPEATALAERLVATGILRRCAAAQGWEGLTHLPWSTWVEPGKLLPELDHPSNEGHLRRLAEEVCGAWVEKKVTTTGPMWRANAEGVLLDCLYPTPGQAYAAAIVAAIQEGEKPEERA